MLLLWSSPPTRSKPLPATLDSVPKRSTWQNVNGNHLEEVLLRYRVILLPDGDEVYSGRSANSFWLKLIGRIWLRTFAGRDRLLFAIPFSALSWKRQMLGTLWIKGQIPAWIFTHVVWVKGITVIPSIAIPARAVIVVPIILALDTFDKVEEKTMMSKD